LKLTGGEYVLLLNRKSDLIGHTLEILPTTDEALKKWNWTTRSSHIFSTDGSVPPNLKSKSTTHLYFWGPIDPGLIQTEIPTFLSLGLYNALFFAKTIAQQNELKQLFERFPKIHWEKWEIKAGEIKNVSFGNFSAIEQSYINSTDRPTKVPASLAAAEEENSMLLATSHAKASVYFPENAREIQIFAHAFRNKFANEKIEHDNDRLSWLVNVNAHLSRHVSQTFSGTSPIMASECPFLSHSLLGTGIASLALVRIRRFVELAVGNIDWIERLEVLKDKNYDDFIEKGINQKRLLTRSAINIHDWLDTEELVASIATQLDAQKTKNENINDEDRLPLITCYSGRDGFRSTPFSLTAPLEVISGCNTYGWSPMTLSHEICHVWMNGILSTIFDNLGNPDTITRLDKLFNGKIMPSNVFEDLQVAFYACVDILYKEMHNLKMHEEDDVAGIQRTWFEKVELVNPQLNEILTHVLDYQFFYHCDEKKYIHSIWSSWDVIPNIKDRLTEYIMRSACALLSERLNNNDPYQTTLNTLERLLTDLSNEHKKGRYLKEAVALLSKERDRLILRLKYRASLVRLAKIFLTDSKLGKRLQHELQEPQGPYASLRVKEFDLHQILNPFRFVLNYSIDREIDKSKSTWILYKIAFAGES
jgi:hypothetical protein